MTLCLIPHSYSALSLLRGKYYYESFVDAFCVFLYIYIQIYASGVNKLWSLEPIQVMAHLSNDCKLRIYFTF